MSRVAKKKKANKATVKPKKKTTKKLAVKKKAAALKKKPTNEKGAYSFQWGDKAKLAWFRAQAKRYGMAGTNLIKVAVEEYVTNRNKDD